ncbi:hypothetical protein F4678DRAFT_411610 [Xylaria arbuscula]|nr:hypothetical protein F4678DRAFT_411610 [Xylaria arbuscula]
MSLKRGLERESCDFCFRRKIKCDRSSCIAAGRPACSQCNLRQTLCTFESDDIRIQRRRKNSPKEKAFDASTLSETRTRQHISHGLINADEPTRADSSTLPFGNDSTASPFYRNTTVSNWLPRDTSNSVSAESPLTTSSLPTDANFEFVLSPNGISFLDSIFLHGHDTTDALANWNCIPTSTLQLDDEPPKMIVPNENPYCASDIQPVALDAAIKAYFSFASLALPILSKDGFMADYTTRQSSSALVFAVACRGCPFIQTAEKWSLQQHFASRFRESFLQALSTTQSKNVVRLDDLEALALMMDFEFESPEEITSPLHSQLGNLLLTHDSLVAMMLQYRIETRITAATGPSTTLSRAAQRQTVLFWYVYGWDAFNSLDRRMASRIRDEDVEPSNQIHGHESQSYFDTLLSLAVIARKMSRVLCGPLAKRKGVKHQDVDNLYKHLEDWRTNMCPSALHIRLSDHVSSSQEASLPLNTDTNEPPPLHKSVVALLGLSCVMQIEACVSHYGIDEHNSPLGQITDMRIKYETLQAAYKIVEVAQWINKLTISQKMSTPTVAHAMADLAPGIIRNVCVGASNWIAQQAEDMFHLTRNYRLNPTTTKNVFGNGDNAELSRQRVKSWIESLTTLRDITATATSHRDTENFVNGLDQQLASLEALIQTNNM